MQHRPRAELRKFVAPEFVYGDGARRLAGRYASNLGARKVLVVSDPGVAAAGWVAEVTASLDEAGVAWSLFTGVSPNPRTDEVMAGAETYRAEGCNLIVAVGGGSPMDCAKGIGLVSAGGRHVTGFAGVDRVSVPGPPLICIPTTAGSSADISQFAIITDARRATKLAIVSKMVVPDLALIDPATTLTLSPELTARTGFDTLVHAIEAYLSNACSPVTDLVALRAIQLIRDNLERAFIDPDNLELRDNLMLASLFAGLAFSNACLGLVHAMAHSLGGVLDLPHGECNALLLEPVFAFNAAAVPERCREIGRALGVNLPRASQEEVLRRTLAWLRRLRQATGLGHSLGEVGVTRQHLTKLVRRTLNDPCVATNPRWPSPKEIEELFEHAL